MHSLAMHWDYKPFYDELAKREFAVFMRETARGLLETLVIRVLGVAVGRQGHSGKRFIQEVQGRMQFDR
jgi:hypothetical protein